MTPRPFWIGRDPDAVPAHLAGAMVAIGNFDGVHRGHVAVVQAALAAGRPAMAMTFEPHPRSVFRPDAPVQRLTDEAAKLKLLARQGLDGAVVMTFDRALAGVTAAAFLSDILVGRLSARGVVVGYDFHFGRGREGSPDFLRAEGPAHGLEVIVVPPFGNGAPISSSAIRSLLGAGEVEKAAVLLGHNWFVAGEVVAGDRRGRELGYPTANIVLAPDCPLAHGIYAVRAALEGRIVDGVASFGRRPTFDDGAPRLEVFLFDFDADIYGRRLEVEFVARIRGEERFDGVAALVAQMDRDTAAARAALARPGQPAAIG